MVGKTAKAATKASAAGEFATVAKASSVGWGEAENLAALDGAATEAKSAEDRRKRLVDCQGFSLKGVYPEQGSWHFQRKKAILEKYPEIEKLFGPNPWSAVVLAVAIFLHLFTGYSLIGASWPVTILAAYTLGAVFAWQCTAVGHEGAHKNVFKNSTANKVIACIAFTPVLNGPFGNFWSVEHMYHHQVIVDKMARYGPQKNSPLAKALGALFFFPIVNFFFTVISMIVFLQASVTLALYTVGLRKTPYPSSFKLPPYKIFPQIVNNWFMFNSLLSIAFNAVLYALWGWDIAIYLFLSCAFSNGLHPLGMRQVQEHYLQREGQPTYSVYSIFNPILLNIGIHVEHHDFPSVAWNNLPKIRKIAPEFYDDLYYYNSYTEVLRTFLFTDGIPISTLLQGFEDLFEIDATDSEAKKNI